MRLVGPEHWAACHFAETLQLKGVPRLGEIPVTAVASAAAATEMQVERTTTAEAVAVEETAAVAPTQPS